MRKLFLTLLTAAFVLQLQAQKPATVAPSNKPAVVKLVGNELTVTYDKQVILKGTFDNDPATFYLNQVSDENNGAVSQSFIITSSTGGELKFSGTITGSEESFPCEADRRTSGTLVVRHTYGLSSSLLNRAVYDRRNDWALSVAEDFATSGLHIIPVKTTATGNEFQISVKGGEISFHFRPHYYQKYRGLKYFEPWTYKVWDKPVVGWCSWFAYWDRVTEKDIHETADELQKTLVPYGLEYLQIDDGYQQFIGTPEQWTKPNDKFPSGMDGLARYISDRGLKPGIWTLVEFKNSEYANAHKNLFVTDDQGEPAKWANGYVIDGSNPAALDQLVKPIYHDFRQMGWQYFKLDGLRIRYEGYNGNAAYFAKKKVDRTEAFRNLVKAVRGEVGRDNLLMACWGSRPELVGIVDACRIGGDGYGLASLTQYNSFNNVVWRNDPDHIELSPKEAYRSCMATSMTGSLFMLTDKAGIYNTPIIEAAKRSIPVLQTLPGQIFDVDPTRTEKFSDVNTELSRMGFRAVDATYVSPYDLFLLEINKPFENWVILGRTGEKVSHIGFGDLGLPTDKEYLVFEFWGKRFVGSFTGGFDMGKIDPAYNCQAFCIRERLDHPQVLATSRHISCGGLELKDVEWKDKMLTGKSELVANDNYTLYINEPEGAAFQSFTCDGVKLLDNKKEGNIRQVTVVSESSKTVDWRVDYK